jgi:ferritin-like metal-binding protein YciE
MKFFSANLDNLRKLYINQLQMLLSAEQQIIDALPKMVEKATDPQLKQAFQSHLQETQVQATRLEQILREETRSADTVKAKTVAALVVEAEDLVKDATDDSVRDAALIGAAQRVEHYEIAAYGTLRTWAYILGKASQAELLDRTIKEEGHADQLLTSIADRVNPAAQKVA